jgi:hypothetical protein
MSIAEAPEPGSPDEVLDIIGRMAEPDRDRVLRGLLALQVRGTTNPLPRQEYELLRVINEGLSLQADERYRELQQKLDAEAIDEPEYQELVGLLEQAEKHDVTRIEAMIELADLRGVSFDELRSQLGMLRR